MQAFALYEGATVHSVHPSVDDAIAKAAEMGFSIKRQGPSSVVLIDGLFNGAGIAPAAIEPSSINEGYFCIEGAEEVEGESYLMAAFDYFPEEDWMNAIESF